MTVAAVSLQPSVSLSVCIRGSKWIAKDREWRKKSLRTLMRIHEHSENQQLTIDDCSRVTGNMRPLNNSEFFFRDASNSL